MAKESGPCYQGYVVRSFPVSRPAKAEHEIAEFKKPKIGIILLTLTRFLP